MRGNAVEAIDTAAVEPSRGEIPAAGTDRDGEAGADVVLHLWELVPVVRARLRIGEGLSDEAILASLAAITSRSGPRERWKVAFSSALGTWLASRGSDLNTSLNVLMALVPKPRL